MVDSHQSPAQPSVGNLGEEEENPVLPTASAGDVDDSRPAAVSAAAAEQAVQSVQQLPSPSPPPPHKKANLDETVGSDVSNDSVIESGGGVVVETTGVESALPSSARSASAASSSAAGNNNHKRRRYVLAGAAGLLVVAAAVGLSVGLTRGGSGGEDKSAAAAAAAADAASSTLADGGAAADLADGDDCQGGGPGCRPETGSDGGPTDTGPTETAEGEEPEEDVVVLDPATAIPTATPTAMPTAMPTAPLTASPTATPTESPTSSPTVNQWVTVPIPSDPDSSYFNYGPKDFSDFGPSDWSDIDGDDTMEAEYWEEYDEWIEPDLDDNMCGDNSGDSDSSIRQSPIDLTYDGATGECYEYHMIKSSPGEYVLDDEYNVRFEIHPSKLRINYAWESREQPADNIGAADIIPGPSADIPKGWGYHLPVVHIDIKVPSEHTIDGKRFEAEYQVFLIQNRDGQRGAPAVSVLFDFHPEDRTNWALQKVLDQFQMLWNADSDDCKDDQDDEDERRNRNLEKGGSNKKRKRRMMRGLQSQSSVWDPWNPEIFRSAWFFGYEGSLTEPPCTEFVEWRIIDVPALISRSQLRQMKNLLFNHVDPNVDCEKTSVHYEGSVARPIQPTMNRTVHKCNCRDYLGNNNRKWYGRNRCWEGDEGIFHEKVDGHWVTSPETKPDKTAGGVWNCNHDEALVPPCCGQDFDPFHECCAEQTC